MGDVKRTPPEDMKWLTERPIAHRGLHAPEDRIYENTLSACQAAVAGKFAIEIDVQLAGDGEAVVFHDADLRRMCGLNEPVSSLTCAELSRISILDSDDTISTLLKTLRAVDGEVPVIVELKGNPPHDAALAEAVVEAVRAYNGKIAVMSFSQAIIGMLVAEHCPCPIGLVARGDEELVNEHEQAFEHPISFISYDVKELPTQFVTQARRERNMPVITWTVRTPEQAAVTYEHADQITFEGFDPDAISNA
ncbi:MAG: glycerophosphodiester phosphodiesterase family protein [Pseudomonadota bacterium]